MTCLTRWLVLAALVACACPNKQGPNGGTGSGTGGIGGPPATTCDGIRGKLEQLYRADAQARFAEADAKQAQRIADAVADNTAMVLNDCAKNPAKVAACVSAASSVAAIESKCLEPLDDEGREGEELRK